MGRGADPARLPADRQRRGHRQRRRRSPGVPPLLGVGRIPRHQGRELGHLVHWIDLDGHEHSEAIPAELFHAQGNELAQRLASNGLPIAPGREKKLIRYLTAFQPEARMISATATGGHGEAFILPQHTIHQPEGERIVLQVVGGASDEAIGAAGRFGAWRDLVAGVPEIVRFLICASLAAPLRYLLNVEAGGFHLCGATSKGKSTALQAAASVWGNGVDPGIAGGSVAYIQRWNATANALTRIFHPLLAFPGGQWMEDVVPRTGRGKAREGLFSRLQAHLSLTPIVCQRAGAALTGGYPGTSRSATVQNRR